MSADIHDNPAKDRAEEYFKRGYTVKQIVFLTGISWNAAMKLKRMTPADVAAQQRVG